MIHPEKLELTSKWSTSVEHLVPKITSSILDGVRTCRIEQENENKIFQHRNTYQPNGYPTPVRIPLAGQFIANGTKCKNAFKTNARKVFIVHHDCTHQEAVRSFIGGLSHCYNNLLTGIWGYASLIGMTLDKDHPLQPHIGQMEALIQDGSNLIHLLFGYIVERRAKAKKLRLNQLIQEIKTYQKDSSSKINLPIFKSGIIRMTKIRDRRQLAVCLSPVITQMMTLVQDEREAMASHCHDLNNARTYLCKIDELLQRGFMLIRDLDSYAGFIPITRKPMRSESMVRQLINRISAKHDHLQVSCEIAPDLPNIKADPGLIAYALNHLSDNAVDATTDNCKIHFKVNTLSSESPHERCGVHTIKNYLVFTVSDNGKGMSTITQAQIFDPFFTGSKGQSKAGLGLAAAAGIIKLHHGYIQCRSRLGKGSIFKIYLPL